MTDHQKKIFFPNLDGLRCFAFIFVFFEHIIWGAFRDLGMKEGSLEKKVAYNLFCNGEFGVLLFFVLSGFLITYLLLSEIELNGKVDVKAFYVRRVLRIWPLYYAVVIFTFIVYPYLQQLLGIYQESCARPAYYFLFLSNFDLIQVARHCYEQGTMQAGVTWSVAIEEQFYLVWPLLFFLLPRQLYRYIFFLLILVSVIFRLVNYDDHSLIYFHTLGVIGSLALGGLIAWYSRYSAGFIRFFEHVPLFWVYTIYIGGFVFALTGDYFIRDPFYTAWSRFVFIAYFAFIICHQNFHKKDDLKLSRLRNISKWGKYTYGMYLLHPIASILATFVYHRIHRQEDVFWIEILEGAGIFVITLLLSYFSYHYFESYFLKLKKRFSYIVKS